MNKSIQRLVAAAAVGLVISAAPLQSAAQSGLRPEVGKPLQAAQELVKAGKYREALAKVRELDAVGGKSAAEINTIERMRLAAASGLSGHDTTRQRAALRRSH